MLLPFYLVYMLQASTRRAVTNFIVTLAVIMPLLLNQLMILQPKQPMLGEEEGYDAK